MSRTSKHGVFVVLGFYALLLGLWQALAMMRLAPGYIFPSPLGVVRRLVELNQNEMLWPGVRATLARMAAGFAMSATLGLCIGTAMGVNRLVNRCLKSLFLGLQTLPTAAWAPLSLMIFLLSDKGVYFVIVMSSAPAIAIATSDGILNIPPIFLRAARTLGTPRWAMIHRVIIPAALPGIVTGLKLGWTMGWHGVVSAELIKSSVGLGSLLNMGRELNDAAQVIGMMLIIILIGVLLDQLFFGMIERRIRRRWGLTEEDEAKQ